MHQEPGAAINNQHPSSRAPCHGCCVTRTPPAGRFAFVELRTEELATTAMTLDKTELLGRTMNIGRPKGYVPGTSGPGVGGGWW